MLELYRTHGHCIKKGDFPLNHDCALKVNFITGSPLRCCYLTCRAQDSGTLVDIISKISVVHSINTYSVDDFEL